MAFTINNIYKKAVITGILGVILYLLVLYGMSGLLYTGESDGPHDVVEGWTAMFFMVVAAVFSFFFMGMASAWWGDKEKAPLGYLIRASLVSGLVAVTLLALSTVAIFNGYIIQLLQLMLLIFSLFYLAAVLFTTMGALFYVFILRDLGSSIAGDPAAYIYSSVTGLLAGLISMSFIALTWDGLSYITIFQLSVDLLVFSLMAASAGIIMALLRYKEVIKSPPMFTIGIAGLIVGALAFTAPLASLLIKGGSIPGLSLIFYSLVTPLPLIAGVILALLGSQLIHLLIRPVKTTGTEAIGEPLPGIFQIKLALAGGILMALLMFFPILFDGGPLSIAYHSVGNMATTASFFIVPIGEAVIGTLAVRHSHAMSVNEAAAIAGITGAISVFILFIGDTAKNFLHLHIFVPDRPFPDMYAYGGMTNVIMCYPFILLILLTIAVCCGIYEYGRKRRIKKYTSE